MAGLAISLGVEGSGFLPNAEMFPPPPPSPVEVTALIPPSASVLYSGQSVSDMAGFAQMVRPGNFNVSQGQILRIDVTATGDAADLTSALSEGQTAGFSVRVEVDDPANTVRVFETETPAVEYMFRTVANTNTFRLDANPIVPDDRTIQFSISAMTGDSAYLNDSYSTTAGMVRSAVSGPVYIDNKNLFYDGAPEDLGAGDTITVQSGLLLYEGQSLTLTYQLQRDTGSGFTDIGAAQTSGTFTLATADEGHDIRGKVIADDGLNAPVIYFTDAVRIAAPAGLQFVGTVWADYTVPGNTDILPYTLDLSAFEAGDALLIATGPTQSYASVTVNGEPATRIASNGVSSRQRMTMFTYTMPGNGTASDTIVATTTGNSTRQEVLVVTGCRGGTGFTDFATDNDGAGEPLSATVTPASDQNVIAAISIGRDANFRNIVWTGVTEDVTRINLSSSGDRGLSAGHALNGPTSGVTATKTATDGADRHAMYVFVYE